MFIHGSRDAEFNPCADVIFIGERYQELSYPVPLRTVLERNDKARGMGRIYQRLCSVCDRRNYIQTGCGCCPNIGAAAMLVSLVVVPVVSLLTAKMPQERLDSLFAKTEARQLEIET